MGARVMTVHDLSEASRRWQKQNIIPQYKEPIVSAPMTDVSRYDHQIKLLRKEMRIVSVKEGDNRFNPDVLKLFLMEWERVFG
jgi:hypothetical protein